MTKFSNDLMLDAALDYLLNNAATMIACSQAPTTRTEAIATFALADIAITSGDFTKADGDVDGRKVTIAAQNAVLIDTSGMGTHVAIVSASALLYVTEFATVRQNTAQAGAATTITLDAAASAVNDFYNDMYVTIMSGTGVGQSKRITDYVGSTKVATVASAWSTNPDATSVFRVFGESLTATNNLNFPAWDIEIADPV